MFSDVAVGINMIIPNLNGLDFANVHIHWPGVPENNRIKQGKHALINSMRCTVNHIDTIQSIDLLRAQNEKNNATMAIQTWFLTIWIPDLTPVQLRSKNRLVLTVWKPIKIYHPKKKEDFRNCYFVGMANTLNLYLIYMTNYKHQQKILQPSHGPYLPCSFFEYPPILHHHSPEVTFRNHFSRVATHCDHSGLKIDRVKSWKWYDLDLPPHPVTVANEGL